MTNYLKLLSFLKDHKRIFAIAVFFMAVSSLFEGVQYTILVPILDIFLTQKKIVVPPEAPDFLERLADRINAIDQKELSVILLVGIIFLFLTKNVVSFWHGYLMNDISQRVMRDARDRLYAKMQNLSLDYFSRKRGGELISRITNDVLLIENATSYGITDLFRQIFLIIVYLTLAFTTHPKGALVMLFTLLFIAIPMSLIGRKLRRLAKSSQERMADINSLLMETISGVKVVKAFNAEDYEVSRFQKKNFDFYKIRMKSIKRILSIAPITEIYGVACAIGILLYFGPQVMQQKISLGIFGLFMSSLLLTISPIKKLGNVNAITQQALAANERIHEVLETQPTVREHPQAKTLGPLRETMTWENVSFQYDAESGSVLNEIHLEIKKGELVAVVGPTGAGKTTLVNLVARFYDPTQGVVRIDGIDLREVTFASLRGQIGIVTQETILFNDTVKANIAYGHWRAAQPEIEAAAAKAFAHPFVKNLPLGYETVIGDRGFRLSGGEKQRIAIARAILKNPPILILDEATSQLDSESEKYVQQALERLMEGRTVIAIAHRLSTVRKASRIVVLDHGRIVGIGPHEDLLATCELYRRLYQMQFNM